jgi:hypothetical protein
MSKINDSNWDHRGASNWGIVVRCENLVGDRLVYLDHNRDTDGGWVIRDFIVGDRLDNEHSTLSLDDIVKDADKDESPPWWNVEREAEWRDYLKTRTIAVLQLHDRPLSTVRPNRPTDGWRKLP